MADDPDPTQRALHRYAPRVAVAATVLAVLVGGGWMWSRWREPDVAARTRQRLAPRERPHVTPDAADIVVRAK